MLNQIFLFKVWKVYKWIEKKKKTQIDVIYANINVLNIKRKRIEEASFNVFALKKKNFILMLI